MIVFIYEIDNKVFGILYHHQVIIKCLEKSELYHYQNLDWYSFSHIHDYETKKVVYNGGLLLVNEENLFEGIKQIIFKAIKTIFK